MTADKKDVLGKARRLLANEIKQSFERGTRYSPDGSANTADKLVYAWTEDFKKETLNGIYRMVGVQKDHFERGYKVSFESPLAQQIRALIKSRVDGIIEDLRPEMDATWEKMRARAAKAVQKAVEAEIEEQLEKTVRSYSKDLIRYRIEALAVDAANKWVQAALPALEAELTDTDKTDEP